jgi:HD-like signal output (HDOD) protein
LLTCPFCREPLSDLENTAGRHALIVCAECRNPLHTFGDTREPHADPVPSYPDVRQIAAPGSMAGALLAQAPAAMESLPVLPEISQRILAMLRNPEFGMAELAAIVREDQVLAAAILKQANSAAFGGLSPIRDLGSACSRLGMKNVANTVQMVANRNLFITGNKDLRQNMERLWRHSVATAHCASQIARITLAPNPESYFLAGLVHDIGKVILLEMIANPKDKVLRDLEDNPALVRDLLEGLHPIFGLLACQTWRLPAEFRAAACFHHDPANCPVSEWLPVAHTIALANTIAHLEGYGMYDEVREAFLASDPSSLFLGLSDIKLATLRVDFGDAMEALLDATA